MRLVVTSLTAGLTAFTFALTHFPATGESWSVAFAVYVIAFFVHWTLLSITVTVRLLRAGRGQPSVSAKRMRVLAFAAATLTIALLGTTFATNQSHPGALVVQLIGFASIVGFYLGIDPRGSSVRTGARPTRRVSRRRCAGSSRLPSRLPRSRRASPLPPPRSSAQAGSSCAMTTAMSSRGGARSSPTAAS
jgi:hypothetical protein